MKFRKFFYVVLATLIMSFSFTPAQAAVNEFNDQKIISKLLTEDTNYATVPVDSTPVSPRQGKTTEAQGVVRGIQYRSLCGYTIWDGKSPKTCNSQYRVYKITANAPLLVVNISNGTKIDAAAIKRGYDSAQRWCSNNSLTCNVLVSAGVTILIGLLM